VFESEHNRERNYLNKVKNDTMSTSNFNVHNSLGRRIETEVKVDKQEGKNMIMDQKERMEKRHHDATQWTKNQSKDYGSFLKDQQKYQTKFASNANDL